MNLFHYPDFLRYLRCVLDQKIKSSDEGPAQLEAMLAKAMVQQMLDDLRITRKTKKAIAGKLRTWADQPMPPIGRPGEIR